MVRTLRLLYSNPGEERTVTETSGTEKEHRWFPFIQTEANCKKNSIASTSFSFLFWDAFLPRTRQPQRTGRLSLYLGSRFPFSVQDLFPFWEPRSSATTDGCDVRRKVFKSRQRSPISPSALHSITTRIKHTLFIFSKQTPPLNRKCNSPVSSPPSWLWVSNAGCNPGPKTSR